jgi:hypothetical protein
MFAFALLASVVTGHDPDLWFLIAVILFAVAAVVCVMEKGWPLALIAAGLCFGFVGLLVT